MVFDGKNTFYVQDFSGIRKISLAGDVTTVPGGTHGVANGDPPRGLAVDSSGNCYLADTNKQRVLKVKPDGQVSTLAGDGTFGFANGPGNTAQFSEPGALAVDERGAVYVADTQNYRIRKIEPDGQVSTFAGSGTQGFADGPAATAQFGFITSILLDGAGNLYVSDNGNRRIRKIDAAGRVSTFVGDGTGDVSEERPDRINSPGLLARDTAGNLFVADQGRIKSITPSGQVTPITNNKGSSALEGPAMEVGQSPDGLAVDGDGIIYFAHLHWVSRISR